MKYTLIIAMKKLCSSWGLFFINAISWPHNNIYKQIYLKLNFNNLIKLLLSALAFLYRISIDQKVGLCMFCFVCFVF